MTLYFDPAKAGGLNKHGFCHALTAEGCGLSGTYAAVYKNKLLNLYDRTSPIPYRDPAVVQDYQNLCLPNTERAIEETALLLSHTHLLGDRAYIDQLLTAIKKVSDNLPAAKQAWEDEQAKAER